MSDLPSGLASISARMDDAPNVRGAVAFGRMVSEREEDADKRCGKFPYHSEPNTLGSAIDRHAALAVSAAYRSADRR